jgi:hypothetical protein
MLRLLLGEVLPEHPHAGIFHILKDVRPVVALGDEPGHTEDRGAFTREERVQAAEVNVLEVRPLGITEYALKTGADEMRRGRDRSGRCGHC